METFSVRRPSLFTLVDPSCVRFVSFLKHSFLCLFIRASLVPSSLCVFSHSQFPSLHQPATLFLSFKLVYFHTNHKWKNEEWKTETSRDWVQKVPRMKKLSMKISIDQRSERLKLWEVKIRVFIFSNLLFIIDSKSRLEFFKRHKVKVASYCGKNTLKFGLLKDKSKLWTPAIYLKSWIRQREVEN